jgi:pimeloyl-ACP methyl ester carboxylesterase
MDTKTLQDGTALFEVSVREVQAPARVVLFAVGAGGNPERHVTLLDALAESGCTVVAPHFQRLASRIPGEAELSLRARRLCLAADAFTPPGATLVGIGHSIGAATLVALAGGQMWLGPGRRASIATDGRLARLGLLAPPTGFFRAPGALDTVNVPMRAWVGSEDTITPPAQSEWLAQALRGRQTVAVRVIDGAGHFSFMDQPPPQSIEPLQDKQAFLREHSNALCEFALG